MDRSSANDSTTMKFPPIVTRLVTPAATLRTTTHAVELASVDARSRSVVVFSAVTHVQPTSPSSTVRLKKPPCPNVVVGSLALVVAGNIVSRNSASDELIIIIIVLQSNSLLIHESFRTDDEDHDV